MDFIDFDTFTKDNSTDNDWNLPQPQPALSLPITNIENLSKKLSQFKLTKNLIIPNDSTTTITVNNDEDELMKKYAKLSINLISDEKKQEQDPENGNEKSSSNSTLSTRLSRVLNDSLNDNDQREIFSYIENNLEENELNVQDLLDTGFVGSVSRSNFKNRIESNLIKNHSKILKEYQPVIKQLKSTEGKLNKFNELNSSTESIIDSHCQNSNKFNARINELNKQQKLVLLKKQLLQSFNAKFTLTEYEEFVLTQSGEMNDEFFKVLSKLQKLNENCYILLSLDNCKLGNDILNKSNQLLNSSNDKIIKFCNKSLGNLYSLNLKSKLVTLQKCLRYLQNKYNYFQNMIDNFINSRSKFINDEFLNYCESNLEIVQQESIRFIGDLLAYVHSLIVNESETIIAIFNINENENDPIIQDIINKILMNLQKPIKLKIDHLIYSETKVLTIFQIFNLLDLYVIMFKKIKGNNLIEVLHSLISNCQDRIFSIISNKLSIIKQSNSARLELDTDLQPPNWIIEFYSDILNLLDQIKTKTILNLTTDSHEKFLDLIINSPVEIFNSHVELNKAFNKKDNLIIKFNFLDLIQSKVIPISLLSDKVIEINSQINDITEKLTTLEYVNLLKSLHLENIYNVSNMICPFSDEFFDTSIYEPIKENKLYNLESMKQIDEKIQEILPNSIIEIQQSLLKVNSPMIVNDTINQVFINFIKFIKKLNLINKEILDFEFTWSDYEMATMLGIEEVYDKEIASLPDT
ncbi:unnamed protein product [Candida verbasci]|uniref:Conserved oligomeric Golgi complex subunit 6 n=1 Tax=Candida verbasci TaxID=1227364 RepID=A0A9W4XBT1_9ASCO|nr:unnamed protein product [Candida verbasci]